MNDNIKDEKIYLLCDDTEEHYALAHKKELKEMEEKLGTHSPEYIKNLIKKYSS